MLAMGELWDMGEVSFGWVGAWSLYRHEWWERILREGHMHLGNEEERNLQGTN